MIRISKGRYIAESNYWLIRNGLEGRVFEYPNERLKKNNSNKRFKDRFGQIAADGSISGIYVDIFYTETGIVLYCIEWDNYKVVDDPEEEEIKFYLYFDKINEEVPEMNGTG